MKCRPSFSVSKGSGVLDEQQQQKIFLNEIGPWRLASRFIGFGQVAPLADMLQTASKEQRWVQSLVALCCLAF